MNIKSVFLLFGFFLSLSFFVVQDSSAKSPPKNGVVRQHYSDGRTRMETVYKKGYRVRWRQYSWEGKLLLDYRYKNGLPYYKKTFYSNGNIRSLWTRKKHMLINYREDGSVQSAVPSEGLSIENP